MNKYMTITDARKSMFNLVEEVSTHGVSVALTHNGTPKAVMMSYEEYEGWQETLAIMADPELDAELLQVAKDIKAGNLHKETVSLEDAKVMLAL